MTLETVKKLACEFLSLADDLHNEVSAYINGSNQTIDEAAYRKVRQAEDRFIKAVNDFYGESYKAGLNYELAESFI